MRRVWMVFTSNSHGSGRLVYLLRQCTEFRSRFNSCPKHPRRFRRGKKSISTNVERDRVCSNRCERLLNSFDRIKTLLADKFQRYMQRLRTHPPRLRREILHAVHEAFQTLANFRCEVKSNKDSHGNTYISFLLTMSSAVCEANQRMCLRSPGKILRTTSTPDSLASA